MKAIMVMYDSLNRHMLGPYGGEMVHTPNFDRLAEKSVTFDSNYIGSMPCMPARRELHTGRYNFLHRGWGPMEPFDDSMPELLKNNGVYSHLVSDHQHYWEDGGCTYHTRYSSWEISRGQEGDPWKAGPSVIRRTNERPMDLSARMHGHDTINREYQTCEEQMPQAVTFQAGLDFLHKNHGEDNWFLQIETFDPHEPFFTQEAYKNLYPHQYEGDMKDWPPYYFVREGEEAVAHIRYEYAALMTMCDTYLGKVLDAMDAYGLWEDTMLIVNTDHGYLIGEHGWWSKTVMPVYEEIAHTPLFLYDPGSRIQGERRSQLTQTIDLPATILDYFGIPLPNDMEGRSILPVIRERKAIRDYALFGYHEGHINITDGRYVYMLAPDSSKDFYEYTLMPTHMRSLFGPEELQDIVLAPPFAFTKGVKTMKIKAGRGMTDAANFGTRFYDLSRDKNQGEMHRDSRQEARLLNAMIAMMMENDCPKERYERFCLPTKEEVTPQMAETIREKAMEKRIPEEFSGYQWENGAVNMYHAFLAFLPEEKKGELSHLLKKQARENGGRESTVGEPTIREADLLNLIGDLVPHSRREVAKYMLILNGRTD